MADWRVGTGGRDLSDWISGWARHLPDKPAILGCGEAITYAELDRRVARMAEVLRAELGVEKGDRVAFLGLNSPRALELLFACARLGAMLVPLNWRLTEAELSVIIADCTPRLLVAEPAYHAMAEVLRAHAPGMWLVDCADSAAEGWTALGALMSDLGGGDQPRCGGHDSPLLICYTSGTTGRPKGAVLTQGAMFWNAVNSTHMHDLRSTDKVLTCSPLFHVGGLCIQTIPAFHAGATVTLHPRFDVDTFFDTVEAEATTLIQLVPTQWNALIAHPRWKTANLSSIRLAVTGSTLVPGTLTETLQNRGLDLIQVYGSTETGPIAVYSQPANARLFPTSTGRPAIHCDIRIVDDAGQDVPVGARGEILVRGENVMSGYWGDPQTSAEVLRDGWFHSGDIGHFDESGNMFVDDRKKDLIISGGENIYPAALESILYECADVSEAAVIGRADPHWGEQAIAVVVRRPGSRITGDEILALFDGRAASYKLPKAVIFVDRLPRSGTGKLLKGEIRKMVAADGELAGSPPNGAAFTAQTATR